MYMVLPSRKSVQQILPLLIPRNSTFLPFNTFNWFFFFFFHGSSKCYLSQGRTKLIPQKWRGWFYGGKDQNTKKSLDHKFTCPPPPPKKKSHTELHDQNTRPPPRIFSYIKPPKIILAEFSYPKNPGIENFKPKKSFDHRRHLKSGVLPLGFCSTPSFFSERFAYDVLHNHKKDSQIRSWIGETYK